MENTLVVTRGQEWDPESSRRELLGEDRILYLECNGSYINTHREKIVHTHKCMLKLVKPD